MPFHVGQHIKCIGTWPCGCCGAPTNVVLGTVYTVKAVWPTCDEGFGIELVETAPVEHEAYNAERFRPVDDSALDIFREALRKAPTRSGPPVKARVPSLRSIVL
jgi:hypothetical protein